MTGRWPDLSKYEDIELGGDLTGEIPANIKDWEDI